MCASGGGDQWREQVWRGPGPGSRVQARVQAAREICAGPGAER